MSLAPGRATRYAPAAFSALALGCAVWWGSRQQLPVLPDGGAAWRLLGHRTVDPRWREWLGMPDSVSA